MWPRGWVEVQLYSSQTAALEGGEWLAARPCRTLPPGKTRYPFYRRLGGPQGRSGRAENLVPTGTRSRIVQPVAQSLYRLSYRAHTVINLQDQIYATGLMNFAQNLWGLFAANLLFGSALNRMVQGGNDRSVIHHYRRAYILGDRLTENVNRRHQLPKRRPFATVLSNLYPQSGKYYLSLSLSMDPSQNSTLSFLIFQCYMHFLYSFFFAVTSYGN